jgi:DNA-binding NarL/FixJ family response regulator
VPTTVLIADDDEAFRALLKRLLGESVTILGEAADGEEAARMAVELHPELVLMDISMPFVDGVAATRRIKAAHPDMKVILLTVYEEEAYLSSTGKSGADALLPKQNVRAEIVATIRELLPDFSRRWNGTERRRKQAQAGWATAWNGSDRRGGPSTPPSGSGHAA